jgi:hypothetical protein
MAGSAGILASHDPAVINVVRANPGRLRAFSTVNRVCMALLYGRAECLTSQNGCSWPGQWGQNVALQGCPWGLRIAAAATNLKYSYDVWQIRIRSSCVSLVLISWSGDTVGRGLRCGRHGPRGLPQLVRLPLRFREKYVGLNPDRRRQRGRRLRQLVPRRRVDRGSREELATKLSPELSTKLSPEAVEPRHALPVPDLLQRRRGGDPGAARPAAAGTDRPGRRAGYVETVPKLLWVVVN